MPGSKQPNNHSSSQHIHHVITAKLQCMYDLSIAVYIWRAAAGHSSPAFAKASQ